MGSGEFFYFGYGANMHPSVMTRRRGLHPMSAEAAVLPGHRLFFGVPGLPWVEPAFATVTPSDHQVVHGVLYRLDATDLHTIEKIESGYDFVDCAVVGSDSGEVEAKVFSWPRPREGLIPSRRYLNLMIEGSRTYGLPDDWIEWLVGQPCGYIPVVSPLFEYGMPLVEKLYQFLHPRFRR